MQLITFSGKRLRFILVRPRFLSPHVKFQKWIKTMFWCYCARLDLKGKVILASIVDFRGVNRVVHGKAAGRDQVSPRQNAVVIHCISPSVNDRESFSVCVLKITGNSNQ